jgi:hypothetical protein
LNGRKYWHPEIEEPEIALPDFSNAIRICWRSEVTRPNVLVLASDVLFQHFFTERSLQKARGGDELEKICVTRRFGRIAE